MTALDIMEVFTICIEMSMVCVNILPIYVGIWYKQSRDKTTVDDAIFVLSCGTISFIVFSVPFGLVSYSENAFDVYISTCNIYQGAIECFQIFSACVIALMSVNVCHQGYGILTGSGHKRTWSRQCTILAILLIVIIAISVPFTSALFSIFSPLDILNASNSSNKDGNLSCQFHPRTTSLSVMHHILKNTYIIIGAVDLTIIAMCFLYLSHLIRTLRVRLFMDTGMKGSETCVERDFRILSYICHCRMVQIVTALFYFFWIPNVVMVLLLNLGIQISDRVVVYAMLGTIMTGLLNPLVYAFCDTTYRQGYSRLLYRLAVCCKCWRKSSDITELPVRRTAVQDDQRTINRYSGSERCFENDACCHDNGSSDQNMKGLVTNGTTNQVLKPADTDDLLDGARRILEDDIGLGDFHISFPATADSVLNDSDFCEVNKAGDEDNTEEDALLPEQDKQIIVSYTEELDECDINVEQLLSEYYMHESAM